MTPTGEPYDGGMYFNPSAEVWVIPSAGGTAVRLAANDPPACTPPVMPNTRVYPSTTGMGQLVGQVVARRRDRPTARATTG